VDKNLDKFINVAGIDLPDFSLARIKFYKDFIHFWHYLFFTYVFYNLL